MRSTRLLSPVMALALAFVLGTSALLLPQTAQAQTTGVTIQNYAFTPPTISVPVGATVTWVNNDPVAHTASSDTGVWDSGVIQPGASYSHTFTQAGTFTYHCRIHPSMMGVVMVGVSQQAGTPTVTVMPSVVVAGSRALVSGGGFTPNNWAFVHWQRPDGTTNGVWIFTTSTGMFTLSLGFNPLHGVGTELVAALDFATGRQAPAVSVSVMPPVSPGSGQLSATINPVPNGGSTLIVGQGFTLGGLVFVEWRRPDGTMDAVWVRANSSGAFAFGFIADPRHGCGPRVFVALDAVRGMWSSPFTLGVRC